jgi:non-ribosomal peptide synthetase component E (peptide arylation enzyme)
MMEIKLPVAICILSDMNMPKKRKLPGNLTCRLQRIWGMAEKM